MTTKIEWVQNPDGTQGETWNPVHGCTPVSSGCRSCYAARMARRLAGRHGYPEAPDHFRVTLRPDRLEQPLRWREPRRVFVVSMGDLFHPDVPDHFIDSIFGIMLMTSQHTYQVLTKRPDRMMTYFNRLADLRHWPVWTRMKHLFHELNSNNARPVNKSEISWPLPNVWLGVSVENQKYMFRIDHLRQIDAHVKFLSLEPLLGPLPDLDLRNINWVIVGGETGPGARPVHPDWVRDIRDQCQTADIPFFFKGWGGPYYGGWIVDGELYHGRCLDGQEWNEFPERRPEQ